MNIGNHAQSPLLLPAFDLRIAYSRKHMERDPTRKPLLVLAGDDEDFLMIMKLALEHAEYKGVLKTVRSEGELLQFLTRIPDPAVIILDFQVPEDRREILGCLKGNRSHERIPVVVLCSSDVRKRIECEDFENCTCIEKPGSFEGWRKAMADVLQRYLPSNFN